VLPAPPEGRSGAAARRLASSITRSAHAGRLPCLGLQCQRPCELLSTGPRQVLFGRLLRVTEVGEVVCPRLANRLGERRSTTRVRARGGPVLPAAASASSTTSPPTEVLYCPETVHRFRCSLANDRRTISMLWVVEEGKLASKRPVHLRANQCWSSNAWGAQIRLRAGISHERSG
jgi:hypothetical protein